MMVCNSTMNSTELLDNIIKYNIAKFIPNLQKIPIYLHYSNCYTVYNRLEGSRRQQMTRTSNLQNDVVINMNSI